MSPASLRRLLLDAIGSNGIKKVARQLVRAAAQGDVKAADCLLSHALGKPAPVRPADLDVTEYDPDESFL